MSVDKKDIKHYLASKYLVLEKTTWAEGVGAFNFFRNSLLRDVPSFQRSLVNPTT